VLVVMRFTVPADSAADFLLKANAALDVLAVRPGWRSARIGRATDDGDLWTVTTEWDSVGAYRRALGDYDVKVTAVPLLSLALDEPSAFEVVEARGLGAEGMEIGSGLADDPWPARG
jgi:heme oxygenase (mycobilin-producing)